MKGLDLSINTMAIIFILVVLIAVVIGVISFEKYGLFRDVLLLKASAGAP